jgi:hypothetical protein
MEQQPCFFPWDACETNRPVRGQHDHFTIIARPSEYSPHSKGGSHNGIEQQRVFIGCQSVTMRGK